MVNKSGGREGGGVRERVLKKPKEHLLAQIVNVHLAARALVKLKASVA